MGARLIKGSAMLASQHERAKHQNLLLAVPAQWLQGPTASDLDA
jgi:hypothetical protein